MILNVALLSKLWGGKNINIVWCFLASDANLYVCFAYYNRYNKHILGILENLIQTLSLSIIFLLDSFYPNCPYLSYSS